MTTTLTSPSPSPHRLSSSSSSSPRPSSYIRPTTSSNATRPLRSSPLVSPPGNEKTRTGATPSRISSVASFTSSWAPSPLRDQDDSKMDSTTDLNARDNLGVRASLCDPPNSRVTPALPRSTSESFAFQMELRPPPRVASVIGHGGGGIGNRDEIGMGSGMGLGISFGIGPGPRTAERGAFTAPGIYLPHNSASSSPSTSTKRTRRPRTAPERDSFSAPDVFVSAIHPASGLGASSSEAGAFPSLDVADAGAHAYTQIPAAMTTGGRRCATSAVSSHPPLPSPKFAPLVPPLSTSTPSPPSTSSDPSRNWLSATNAGPPPFSRTRLGATVVMPVKKGSEGEQGTKKDKLKRPKTAPERSGKERAMGTETKLRMLNEEGSSGGTRNRRKSILAIGELGELREEEGSRAKRMAPDTDGSVKSSSTNASLLSPSSTIVSSPMSTPSLSRDNSSNTISTSRESVMTLPDYGGIASDLKKPALVYGRGKHQRPGAGDIFAAEKQKQLQLLQAGGRKQYFKSNLKHSHSANVLVTASGLDGHRDAVNEKCIDPYTEEKRTNMDKWKAFLKMVGIKLTRRKGQAGLVVLGGLIFPVLLSLGLPHTLSSHWTITTSTISICSNQARFV
ncbi:hypothetical protein BU17DRAFT_95109 [Hysterangium stoloniferum]|nr:hypothetical protein BU17DRAFT_95109 [Hysterangium stoloniferum]